MNITLPLDRMTTEDKLRTMEALWDDLSKNSEEACSPSWHEDILKIRAERVKTGEEAILDWENAKAKIRKKIQ